jgi:ATP-binding cassette subfamily C protein LapB
VANSSDEALMTAVGATGLEGLIRQHPMGLDLPITEGGQGLSGGQRALVGLTRALLFDPAFLFLDEATANLDPETEANVLRKLFAQHARSAIVMVTHKSQLLRLVDRLIVMMDGRIVLDGKTEDVLERLRPKPQDSSPQAKQFTYQADA